jgi:hypothetical protein
MVERLVRVFLMTNRIRPGSLLACGLAALGALVAVLLNMNGEDERGGPVHRDARSGYGSFAISGDVTDPITPGVRAAIDLEFTNRHLIALSVRDIQVSIRGVTAPHADRAHPCSIADFSVEQVPPDTDIEIPARKKRTLSGLGLPQHAWPFLVLVNRPVNQDGCKGASLVLAYSAVGTIGR